jgi:hypothetical protein
MKKGKSTKAFIELKPSRGVLFMPAYYGEMKSKTTLARID